MKATGNVELPPSFIHRILQVNRFEQELVCDGFKISSKFPNNIVLLTGKRAMYCISFSEETSGEGPTVTSSRFYLYGFIFGRLRPQWVSPCSSARIGYYLGDRLKSSNLVKVTGMELVSKCFIFARDPYNLLRPFPEIDPLPPKMRPVLRAYNECRDEGEVEILKESLSILGKRFMKEDQGFNLDYWWIMSIVVPGRYTNHFQ